MSTIVVMSGGGLKGAGVCACLGTEHRLVLLHVRYGQLAAKAEADAVTRLADAIPNARAATVEMPHLLNIEEYVARAAEDDAEEPTVSGRRLPAPTALTGLMPALVAVGVQCATRMAATRVVVGLSQHVESEHLGLPTGASQDDRLKDFLHATNVSIEVLAPQRSAIRIEAPLVDRSYAEIVKIAAHARMPFEHTWTCNQPPSTAARPSVVCGRCDACKARAGAFVDARYADPLTTKPPATPAPV